MYYSTRFISEAHLVKISREFDCGQCGFFQKSFRNSPSKTFCPRWEKRESDAEENLHKSTDCGSKIVVFCKSGLRAIREFHFHKLHCRTIRLMGAGFHNMQLWEKIVAVQGSSFEITQRVYKGFLKLLIERLMRKILRFRFNEEKYSRDWWFPDCAFEKIFPLINYFINYFDFVIWGKWPLLIEEINIINWGK